MQEETMVDNGITFRRLAYFCVLASIVATLVGNFVFGENAFLEIHPMVRAAMDPGYLPGDMVATASREFGPRFYFVQLLAFVATPETLPVVYFAATLLINVAIALVVALFARDIFKSNAAGFVAVAIAMSVSTFSLGATRHVWSAQVNANWLAWPISLLGVWAAYRNRPLLSGLAAGIAMIMHPTFALELGALCLGAMALAVLMQRPSLREGARQLVPIVGGFAILAAFSLAYILPMQGAARIPDAEFREIRLLRSAHELVPSSFPLRDWVQAVFFLTGAGLAWRSVRRRGVPAGSGSTFLIILVLGVFATLVGGYVFVELYPVRIWFLIDAFHRLTPVLTWLGVTILAGGVAVRLLDDEIESGALLHATTVSAVSVGLGQVLVWARDESRLPAFSTRATWRALALAIVVLGIVIAAQPRAVVQFLIINALGAWLVFAPLKLRPVLMPSLATGALAIALIGGQSMGGLPGLIDEIGPEILPSHREGAIIDIGERAKAVLAGDALVLTPPNLGDFRITAERSILVDFKAIPYQEDWMVEWRERLIAAYGEPEGVGSDASQEMDVGYRSIRDDRITSLCRQYGITHAVLYAETPTSLDVIERNETYSLVEIGDC